MRDPSSLEPLARDVLARCIDRGLMIATAESCTGGLVSTLLTEIPGSSAVVERGFVTYSNEAKTEMLGVPAELIAEHGAVSREVALAMAEGALRHSRADIAAAVTGIAGPGGGSPQKPVGLVHFAFAMKDRETVHVEKRFPDVGRSTIRLAALRQSLEGILNLID
ncbi:CinA family protein [Stappia sp. F7233]|uniref:CinA family protein n=1 Tax=Stappia albiluteola TaxID=2758565 RepID=A0A839ABM2_9HYPH|nr:CinA family protein [Stappia albiluteola]MBA5776576.1 CinA family protein [Stappia albiluteola]